MSRALNLRLALALVLSAAAALSLAHAPVSWPDAAPVTLGIFMAAVVGWTVLRWPDTSVALAACLGMVIAGVSSPAALYASLGDSLIWLLIGAFLLSAVLQQSGLAERWTLRAVARAGTAQSLLWHLAGIILITAFVVPSTSGRAALLLPVFLVLARTIGDRQVVRAMALLFPSVILLSACASLLGAGAHLLAADFMQRAGTGPITFATWALWGLPFAVVSSAAATFVIARLFLDREARTRPLSLPLPPDGPLTPHQKGVAAVALAAIVAWVTSGWHGLDASLVAVAGGLAATCKPLTGMDMKAALKRVEWNLVLFLAATLVMGDALLESGAARTLANAMLQALPIAELAASEVIALAAALALMSHLLIPSRTARALVLLPTVALPLASAGVNPAMLIFVCVVGSGFCQTLVVSAKPLAVFARAELPAELDDIERPIDAQLLRLSMALLPFMALLLWGFACYLWPALGLALVVPAVAG